MPKDGSNLGSETTCPVKTAQGITGRRIHDNKMKIDVQCDLYSSWKLSLLPRSAQVLEEASRQMMSDQDLEVSTEMGQKRTNQDSSGTQSLVSDSAENCCKASARNTKAGRT